MKKLMLLGGSRYLVPVIEAAHNLGLYVITCDYLPNNYAHNFSDKYLNISIIDNESVLEAAINHNIDGIMSFACDPGVVTASYVAEKLGLPSCGSYDSVRILQNKDKFRSFLKENGFNVPKANGYSSLEEVLTEIDSYCFPVIIKPVDSAGSKGVTRVNNPSELEEAVRYAIAYSKTNRIIVEEFIQQQYFSSDSDCFSVNGKLVFCSFSNQHFDNNAKNPFTPSSYSWPSTMPAKTQTELRSEIQRLITLLGLNTSIYNIETRLGTDGKSYIMEVSPRGGGNRLSEMLILSSHTDLILNAVKAAVGYPVDYSIEDPTYSDYWAIVILHSDCDGRFVDIIIDESIKQYIFEVDLWVNRGDIVHEFSGANEAIGTVVLKADSFTKIEECLRKVSSLFKVLVEKI